MEAKSQPIRDALNPAPPEPLSQRTAFVQHTHLNTIVIPHDPADTDSTGWFADDAGPASQPVPVPRPGNEVQYLVDGLETYTEFESEINQTVEGDFIYLIGWWLDLDMRFPCGLKTRDLLLLAATKKVQIRVMIPRHAGEHSQPFDGYLQTRTVDWINLRAPASLAVLDNRVELPFGTHHQKILLVSRQGRLTAFCGGVDINSDRLQHTRPGTPLHDVHCRVRGPAAEDLLQIFCERWADFLAHPFVDHEQGLSDSVPYPSQSLPLSIIQALERRKVTREREEMTRRVDKEHPLLGAPSPKPRARGPLTVQIARTYGCAGFDFAPVGERSVRSLLHNAIRSARRFIYIEDQYLVDMEIAEALRNQLDRIQHLTILFTPPPLAELPKAANRQHAFYETLNPGTAMRRSPRSTWPRPAPPAIPTFMPKPGCSTISSPSSGPPIATNAESPATAK